MKYTLLAGSLRKESYNRKLLSVIEKLIGEEGPVELFVVEREDIELPLYNQDIEDKEGLPKSVKKIATELEQSDGLIISSPEYNGSISSPLKNTIDWISRIRPIPFKGLPILFTGASPSGLGGMRGIAHSKAPFEAVGAYVYPQHFALPKVFEAFDDNGELLDSDHLERLSSLLSGFHEYCEKLKKD